MEARFTAAVIVVGALAAWGTWYLGRAFSLRRRLHGVRAAQAPASSAAAAVKAWAKGRQCVVCGGALAEPRFTGHHIALLEPGGMTREWVDVAADRLPLALATSLPVCWNCHVAATFRRLHPELVTDRDEATVHVHDSSEPF